MLGLCRGRRLLGSTCIAGLSARTVAHSTRAEFAHHALLSERLAPPAPSQNRRIRPAERRDPALLKPCILRRRRTSGDRQNHVRRVAKPCRQIPAIPTGGRLAVAADCKRLLNTQLRVFAKLRANPVCSLSNSQNHRRRLYAHRPPASARRPMPTAVVEMPPSSAPGSAPA